MDWCRKSGNGDDWPIPGHGPLNGRLPAAQTEPIACKTPGFRGFSGKTNWCVGATRVRGGGGSQERTRLRTNSLIAWYLQGKTPKIQGFDPRSSEIHPYFQPVTGKFPKPDNRELSWPIRELSGKSANCSAPRPDAGRIEGRPDGPTCPKCPFWANRDRWSGEMVH